MYADHIRHTYTLSGRDLAVLHQVKGDFREFSKVTPRHPDMPPLWSRLPYVMLLHDEHSSSKCFWRSYRAISELLKTRDSHYLPARIPKNSGGTRSLLVPDGDLQKHQWFIRREILDRIPVSEYACAYHKHRGLRDLAQPHIGHRVLIHMDIRDFFSSITEQMVFEALLEETGYPKSVVGMLSRLCCYKRYLPQGAGTSPALSNICFKPCDEQLGRLAQENDLAYTRYCDDIYLSGNRVDATAIIRQVRQILERQGFRVHSEKTRVLGPHQAQKVTAIVVNEKMQVSREYRRKLRQELYYVNKFHEDAGGARKAEDYEHYLRQLQGKIAFVLYVDPQNEEFLKAKATVEALLQEFPPPRWPYWPMVDPY